MLTGLKKKNKNKMTQGKTYNKLHQRVRSTPRPLSFVPDSVKGFLISQNTPFQLSTASIKVWYVTTGK